MADLLLQICDELGVCKEEALFYLEGFQWDLNAAMEACRSKTLPPSENERAAAENERASAEERSRDQLIKQFVETTETTEEEARYYLSRKKWNLQDALSSFLDHPDDYTEMKSNLTPPVSRGGNTETWYPEGLSGNDVMQDVLSKVPQFHNASTGLRIGSPPSSSTPPFEPKEESIEEFHVIAPGTPRTVVIECLKHCNGIVENAVTYFYNQYSQAHLSEAIKEELLASFSSTTGQNRKVAKDYLDKYKWNLEQATNFFFDDRYSEPEVQTSMTQSPHEEAGEGGDVTVPIGIATAQVVKNFSGRGVDKVPSTEPIQHIPEAKPLVTSSQVEEESGTLPLKEEESAEVKEEHISSFVKMTEASSEDAIANLEHFKWDVNQAVKFYQEHGYSAEVISGLSLSLTGNSDPPLPEMGLLPSQSQFEASYVSSGSMETQSSPEEAGEGAEVDGKAVEEGSSVETTVETQTVPSTITITIILADGTELKLPFRPNQTIRDIRNAIDQLYPDHDRGYVLQSMDLVEYKDWDITVGRACTGGYTSLFQVYP